MTDIILHHFDASPFAEKIRKILGIKALAWHSVEIPMILPKPDLMPLSGGYRKTPVMQVGAEVYCDTRLIIEELDRRFPAHKLLVPNAGMAIALASWSDKAFFEPGAALSMALNKEIPAPVLEDRKAFFEFMDFDELENAVPYLSGQFLAQVDLIERQLAAGCQFLFGEKVSVADVLAWFPLWMVRNNVPGFEKWLEEFTLTAMWEKRMQRFGYGERSEMSAAQALAIAAAAEPAGGAGVIEDPVGLRAGARVSVTPTDYGAVAVKGELITLRRRRITLRRHDERVGAVNTHFPRSGYRIKEL